MLLTACATVSRNYSTGETIIFDKITESVGMSNKTGFVNTGKFTCEHPGLYVAMFTMFEITDNDLYFIYKNDDTLTFINSGKFQQETMHTVSGSAATYLKVKDTLSIRPNDKISHLGSIYSCLSIVKV